MANAIRQKFLQVGFVEAFQKLHGLSILLSLIPDNLEIDFPLLVSTSEERLTCFVGYTSNVGSSEVRFLIHPS